MGETNDPIKREPLKTITDTCLRCFCSEASAPTTFCEAKANLDLRRFMHELQSAEPNEFRVCRRLARCRQEPVRRLVLTRSYRPLNQRAILLCHSPKAEPVPLPMPDVGKQSSLSFVTRHRFAIARITHHFRVAIDQSQAVQICWCKSPQTEPRRFKVCRAGWL